jgi:multimeric flavodoxin WrbA
MNGANIAMNKKHIVAINASPRSGWNTDIMVREVARGAQAQGAEVEVIDLYKLDQFMGCMSCFACKTKEHLGVCVYPDGLAPVLEKIRGADGLIMGSPIYLGDITAGLRALYERLIFQSISYKIDPRSYNKQQMPVVLVATSNCAEEQFAKIGYDTMLEGYRSQLAAMFGSCELLVADDTWQVNDYEKYDWTVFDPEKKKQRRETVFPKQKETAFALGVQMV